MNEQGGSSEQSCPWAMPGLWQLTTSGRGVRGIQAVKITSLTGGSVVGIFLNPWGRLVMPSAVAQAFPSQGQCCSEEKGERPSRGTGLAGRSRPLSSRDRKS